MSRKGKSYVVLWFLAIALPAMADPLRGQTVYLPFFQRGAQLLADRIDATTGALTPLAGSPFALGARSSRSVAVDPTGKFLYFPSELRVKKIFSPAVTLSPKSIFP